MKLIIATDSYKGSLSATEAAQIIARVGERVLGIPARCVPIADGGEGTVDALRIAMGGEARSAVVHDALGEAIEARYAVLGDTAVLEIASCAGLAQLAPTARNPEKTSSRGLGELMAQVLAQGCRKLLIGLGGSATNDGGMGLLAALGARFLDARGNALYGRGEELANIERVDLDGLALPDCAITAICDVTNPLMGAQGATAIYGPQKGATQEQLERLEAGMRHYARCMEAAGLAGFGQAPGSGAAGGLGAALHAVLGARIQPGIDAVLDFVHFDALLEDACLVVTGEGRFDAQTVRYGKGPIGVLRRSARRGVPVAILAGSLGEGAEEVFSISDCALASMMEAPCALEYAMEHAAALLERATERLFFAMRAVRRK